MMSVQSMQLSNCSFKAARSLPATEHPLFAFQWCLSSLFRAHKYHTYCIRKYMELLKFIAEGKHACLLSQSNECEQP